MTERSSPDIVARLRDQATGPDSIFARAADEIERLRASVIPDVAQAAQSSAVNEVELRNDLGKTLDILRGPNYPGGSAIMAIADAFSMIEVIISKLPDEQARCSRCGGIVDIDTIGQTSHDVYGCPARLSADTASPQAAPQTEVFRRLLRTAQLLQQNSEGCAVNHHGLDFEQQGLPGWLVDTQKAINEAALALSRPERD